MQKLFTLYYAETFHIAQTQIQTPPRILIPNTMATLYYAETFHIAQTQTEIPIQTQIPSVPIFWGRYPYPAWDPSLCPAM